MNLIITDGAALNPGDLDWSPLSAFGQIIYFPTTPPELVTSRCENADIIITNKTLITAEAIRSASQLKMIAVTATGYNNIDVAAATSAGVTISNVPEYGTYSVAQHALSMLLELTNHVGINAASTRHNGWTKAGSWTYTLLPVTELKDKTLGIIGFGRIGRQLARLGEAFGMRILFNNRSVVHHPTATQTDLKTVFAQSDVVSLHCPLTPDNKYFVNLQLLSVMKPTAYVINTSRGPLINEEDLLAALDRGLLAGAALDVLATEPPPADHPLVDHPKCLITPHNAWISVEARARLMFETIRNIEAFIEGKPRNVVNAH